MAIPLNFVLESRDFQLAINRAASALGRALPEVYREELDRLMRDLIRKTPPRTKSQGLRRTKNDILFTVVPVTGATLNSIQKSYGPGPGSGPWIVKGKRIQIAYAKILRSIEELRQWHHERRHRVTGRVRRVPAAQSLENPTKAFAPIEIVRAYIRSESRHVGAAKGGWAAAQAAVARGRPLPSWITEKKGQGSVQADLRAGPSQTFVAINRSNWTKRSGESERVARDALRNRARSIPLNVARVLRRSYSLQGILATP